MRQTRYQSHRSECDNTFNLNRISDEIQLSFHNIYAYLCLRPNLRLPMSGRKILA